MAFLSFVQQRPATEATARRRKRIRDGNGATPHPPAQFGSKKFCKRNFAQTIPPARAVAGVFWPCRFCKLRKVLQRFAKFTASPAANQLINTMFLKGSFCFPSRSKMVEAGSKKICNKRVKPCRVRVGGVLVSFRILQKAARMSE